MQFLLKLHDTSGIISSVCLYYRYMDILLYVLGIGTSILFLTLFPSAVVALLCGGSYLSHQDSKVNKIEKEASQVMGWIHLLLGGSVLLILWMLR